MSAAETEGMVALHVSVRIDASEMRSWEAWRIRTFFTGLVQAIEACDGPRDVSRLPDDGIIRGEDADRILHEIRHGTPDPDGKRRETIERAEQVYAESERKRVESDDAMLAPRSTDTEPERRVVEEVEGA